MYVLYNLLRSGLANINFFIDPKLDQSVFSKDFFFSRCGFFLRVGAVRCGSVRFYRTAPHTVRFGVQQNGTKSQRNCTLKMHLTAPRCGVLWESVGLYMLHTSRLYQGTGTSWYVFYVPVYGGVLCCVLFVLCLTSYVMGMRFVFVALSFNFWWRSTSRGKDEPFARKQTKGM